MLLGTLYKAPYVDILKGDPSKLEESLTRAAQMSKNIMLIGDINIDLLKSTPHSEKLTELCENVGLHQKIKQPTRLEEASATLIDHMWATDDCATGESGVLAGISDHLITFIELKKPPKEEDTNITCRSYKDYNAETAQNLYNDLISKSELRHLIQKRDINGAMEEWIRILRNVCDATAPIKTFKIPKEENHVPWFNSEVHHLKNVKESLLTIKHKDRHPLVKEQIRKITNRLKTIKRKLKREYLTKKIEEKANDGKKLWEILR